ncbi:protein halfway [Uranotaenia lowii]|uniref:protein halfway n=1 Tax=Uranotaenia lowii TaxID=190385 RepID=UPI00247A6E94|nr:protein halfway [Uranotaenia lowii]XP_055585791.1 protein halfway [Uranotaenia lowii]XP_055585792.1 protein halfway [Uranotaenia lowii]XP_055585793.1 protein halfway [Uranotaenia lowii]
MPFVRTAAVGRMTTTERLHLTTFGGMRLATFLLLLSLTVVGGRIVADHPGSNSLSTESAPVTTSVVPRPLEIFAGDTLSEQVEPVVATEITLSSSTPSSTTTEAITTTSSTTEATTSTTTSTTSTSSTTTTTSTTTTSTSTVPTTTTTLIPPTNKWECYNAAPELCHNRTSDCECNPDPMIPGALFCCNVTDINKAIACALNSPDNGGTWKYLHMRNVTVPELALNISNRYIKTLLSLSITDGSIQRISSSFARFSSPVCLNVSNNNISDIEARAFRELRHLQTLDISHNNLTTIPATIANLNLDIRGNANMQCKSLLEALKENHNFNEKESTFCKANRTINWFDATDNIPLNQLIMGQQVQNDCPQRCACELNRLNFDPNNTERKRITTKVVCSGQGLADFPETLPQDTVDLDVSNNNITSLKALIGKSYSSLMRLNADNNQITSLNDLEGTNFISRFTLLSLQNNKLKTIQTYQFKFNLDLGSFMFLAGNPMTCDCNAAKNLKNWLLSKKAQVPDHDMIHCEGNVHQSKIVQIQESKLCQSQHDWTDYIYYLIGTEIFLLIALICKVSYDYWVFKTAGYLPWPANKMPKLPCDCLCE